MISVQNIASIIDECTTNLYLIIYIKFNFKKI